MTAKFSIWIFKRSVRKCILQFCFEPARKYFSNTFSAATEDQVVLSRMFFVRDPRAASTFVAVMMEWRNLYSG